MQPSLFVDTTLKRTFTNRAQREAGLAARSQLKDGAVASVNSHAEDPWTQGVSNISIHDLFSIILRSKLLLYKVSVQTVCSL